MYTEIGAPGYIKVLDDRVGVLTIDYLSPLTSVLVVNRRSCRIPPGYRGADCRLSFHLHPLAERTATFVLARRFGGGFFDSSKGGDNHDQIPYP